MPFETDPACEDVSTPPHVKKIGTCAVPKVCSDKNQYHLTKVGSFILIILGTLPLTVTACVGAFLALLGVCSDSPTTATELQRSRPALVDRLCDSSTRWRFGWKAAESSQKA